MTPRETKDAPTPVPQMTARGTTQVRRTAWLLLCTLLASVVLAVPAHGQVRRSTPSFPYFCMDGLGKPQLCIQWSRRDVRRFDELVAGVGATAATQWLCDQVPKSPVQLAVRAGCVAVLGLYFGHVIRAFQVAADKGQCVRLRFTIPPAAVNGVWRIRC